MINLHTQTSSFPSPYPLSAEESISGTENEDSLDFVLSNKGKNRNSKCPENDGNGSKTQQDTHRQGLF